MDVPLFLVFDYKEHTKIVNKTNPKSHLKQFIYLSCKNVDYRAHFFKNNYKRQKTTLPKKYCTLPKKRYIYFIVQQNFVSIFFKTASRFEVHPTAIILITWKLLERYICWIDLIECTKFGYKKEKKMLFFYNKLSLFIVKLINAIVLWIKYYFLNSKALNVTTFWSKKPLTIIL